MTEAALVLPLATDRAGADLAELGGKGASLSRLARAGLPVPPGFHVTTEAYRCFTAPLQPRIQAALADLTGTDDGPVDVYEEVGRRIAGMFDGRPLPDDVVEAVRKAYAGLAGEDVAVAVRSSATAEDLPGMSFAGQQDTYLNVRGEPAVLDAVRRCWASLWNPRAIAYRARNGVPQDSVALAVVVQQMVPADSAGVLFTADPATGARERMIVNAAWGLGEAVVGGQVTPDTVAATRGAGGWTVAERYTADKTVMTVRTADGTREEPVPEDRRTAPVLDDAAVIELAGLGERIEELYGTPMDIEWARHDGRTYVVQARPITRTAAEHEVWNDSLDGDYLWTNANLGEAIPNVMTPCTWSLVKVFMGGAMPTASLPDFRAYGNIGGRFYMNLSLALTLAATAGVSAKRFASLTGDVFGRLPDGMTIPRVPLSRAHILRGVVPAAVRTLRDVRRDKKQLDAYVAEGLDRCADLRERVAAAPGDAALLRLWHTGIDPYFRLSCRMLSAAGRQDGAALVTVRARLRDLVGEADANAMFTGLGSGAGLASLGPVQALERLAAGEIDRATFDRTYGHRGPDEFEVSIPRPAEDPAWLDRQLAGMRTATQDVTGLLAKQEEARAAAWRRFAERYPRKEAATRARIESWSHAARAREETRSEVIRVFWVLRAFVRRAGELTGHGDDLFFLPVEEVLALLGGDTSVLERVAVRRATYERYRALPAYPALIRGRFDPFRWAADPDRRSDVYDEHHMPAPSDTVTGFAGAEGVVEGVARVIADVSDGERLGAGEVLVTTVTNIGWTPLFPRASAVVTDVGAPLSHAAIVARELGIPAVVGCGNATMRITDGAHVRVDGGKGVVEVL